MPKKKKSIAKRTLRENPNEYLDDVMLCKENRFQLRVTPEKNGDERSVYLQRDIYPIMDDARQDMAECSCARNGLCGKIAHDYYFQLTKLCPNVAFGE